MLNQLVYATKRVCHKARMQEGNNIYIDKVLHSYLVVLPNIFSVEFEHGQNKAFERGVAHLPPKHLPSSSAMHMVNMHLQT
jgi:hypothetical protein